MLNMSMMMMMIDNDDNDDDCSLSEDLSHNTILNISISNFVKINPIILRRERQIDKPG